MALTTFFFLPVYQFDIFNKIKLFNYTVSIAHQE